MLVMKCSLHLGHKHSRAHNVRKYDKNKWNKDGHIDPDREHLNSVLVDTDYIKFIDETFGAALVEYNEKNRPKHPERLIGFKNGADYDKCSEEERRSRAVKAYAKEHKKDVQEAIIQLGDHGEYEEMVKLYGQEKADEMYSLYLTEAYEKWKADNPSLRVFCSAVHLDEVRDGTPHLHIDFLPVAESEKGLKTKVSMDGALDKLGFERKKGHKYAETPYKLWLKNRRAGFENFAQSFANEHKLRIIILPSEPSKAGHEEPQDYKSRRVRIEKNKSLVQKGIDLIKKGKNLTQETAEIIVGNAQAVADGIAAEAIAERKVAAEKEAEAGKMYEVAKVARERYEKARKDANEQRKAAIKEKDIATAERAELANKSMALEKTVHQQVRRRLQAEKLHMDMSKTSAAQQRKMRQIGVDNNENDLTASKEH